MKRFTTLLLVLTLAGAAYAQGVPSPSNPRLMVGADGSLVSTTNPLPVTATGTTTTAETPQTTGTSSVILLSSTAQEITAAATQRWLFLLASGTFQYGLGSTTAVANRQGVYNVSIPGRLSVSVWTTATPTYLNVDKLGD